LHTDHVTSVVGEKRSTLALTVESVSERGQPRPVITAGNGAVVRVELDWSDIEHLANAMIREHLKYAPFAKKGKT
jgi:hypothetical protein